MNPLRTLGGSNCSRCGAVHILRSQVKPSAHFGRVEPNPLRTFRGSNRSRCGAGNMLRSNSETLDGLNRFRRGAEHILRSRSHDPTRDERNASRVET